MGKTVRIKSGGGSVKNTQPPARKGGVRATRTGTKGSVRSGSLAGSGGGGWAHLPSSYKSSSKGTGHQPSTKHSGGGKGPTYPFLPKNPSGTGR